MYRVPSSPSFSAFRSVRDLHAEICFKDRYIRPSARDQLVVADDLAGTLHQGNQEIERAPAQMYRLVGPLELPAGHKQTKRTKGKGFLR